MKATEVPIKSNNNSNPIKNQGQMKIENTQNRKPPFRPARDDTKPPLHDPVTVFFFLSLPFSLNFAFRVFLIFCFFSESVFVVLVLVLFLWQILRSDPIETEEAVLRLPPFSINRDHKI